MLICQGSREAYTLATNGAHAGVYRTTKYFVYPVSITVYGPKTPGFWTSHIIPESSLPGNYDNAACRSLHSAANCMRTLHAPVFFSSGDLNAIAEVERY